MKFAWSSPRHRDLKSPPAPAQCPDRLAGAHAADEILRLAVQHRGLPVEIADRDMDLLRHRAGLAGKFADVGDGRGYATGSLRGILDILGNVLRRDPLLLDRI